MAKEKKKKDWKEKVQDEFPDFTSSVDVLKVDDLNKRMLEYSKYMQEVEDTLEEMTGEGSKVEQLRNEINVILGPSKDAKKALKLKMKYINHLIKSKGAE